MWQTLLSYAAGTVVALFPIANPIGAIPIFYSLTEQDSPPYRHAQARAVALNVLWVLALFLFAGREILGFFGISLDVLRIAGGLLVAHTAWQMVTVRQRLTDLEHEEAIDKEDISFTPMAVPLVSGPGAIGIVISISARLSDWASYVGSLMGVALLAISLYFCLTLGEPLVKALGRNGLGALNRVFGFFILAIAVQFISEGSLNLLREALGELFHQT
ncbi:antibiotic resistance protein MarC [Leptolyngbya sp. 'hensonii']|uniref:MarC family protein n=1 Tax=Leptolyngbya sp. 'hensonii' TaxID=1922337 RepID=UPI00094F603D|nr:MarC family protein [Leptolyngbya sp. 'hensonii']OLP19726.1 antibiotic resistance protein MarC [Leptolyngbya sp. 'hensonii']